ncbi:outer membrane lipoprotein-sorting protein [Sphaerochaeta halotolerans]|uniref:outer membrane lipoprotein-sorting protein n=1 Tax=Sphaerochaeta halotolerans TaxID=2293840 RepID=UPI00136E99E5|nr:outer membrane lipoprotein-sorting protein [Sphaerochaeta halotolerans]MXI86447.1 outer membrane lipoprotein-sorting protein [Sphaerochaeta halotolerans]
MRTRTTKRLSVLTLLITFVLLTVSAATPSGSEIMWEVYNRDSGETMSANLIMTITNARGAVRERSIAQYRMDKDGVESKLMFFLSPSDVRNTSFLSFSYEDGRSDDQYIYLPAIKRVKRIASTSKNDSFMGSDFTYDDMGSRHPDLDVHKVLRKETIDGVSTLVVESIAKGDEDYPRTLSWIVDGQWFGLKKEFYLPDGTRGRTLTIDSYEEIDSIYVITDMTMRNLEGNTSTRIRMEDVEFNLDFNDNFFSERQMKIGPRR